MSFYGIIFCITIVLSQSFFLYSIFNTKLFELIFDPYSSMAPLADTLLGDLVDSYRDELNDIHDLTIGTIFYLGVVFIWLFFVFACMSVVIAFLWPLIILIFGVGYSVYYIKTVKNKNGDE